MFLTDPCLLVIPLEELWERMERALRSLCAFCFLLRSPRDNLVATPGKADSAAGSAGGGIILVVTGREGEWGYQFDLSVGDYQRNDVVEALGRAGGWSGPNELDVRGNEGVEGMLQVLSRGAGADPRAGRLSRSVGGGLRLKQAVGVLQSGGEFCFGIV